MFRFLDGPVAGTRLSLHRAPMFLRVVISSAGKIDALDQLDDEAEDDETIHVYRLVPGSVSKGIFCSRGRGGGCNSILLADYRVCGEQPTDAQARNREAWSKWAHQQFSGYQATAAGEEFVSGMAETVKG